MVGALRSPLLSRHGFAHAFFTREGGVSEGAFESLSFSIAAGDRPEHVAENLRRARAALGVDAIFYLSQVHGALVVEVGDDDTEASFVAREGDAVVATRAGAAAAVRIADCAPVLIGATRTGAALAVHAGWRGAVAGVVTAGVSRLRARVGDEPLVAAIGPHISRDAFEVGDDVAAQIASAARVEVIDRRSPRPHADLRAMLAAELDALGVEVEHVDGCTYGDRGRFFSFRRDGKASGRHLAAIAVRAARDDAARHSADA